MPFRTLDWNSDHRFKVVRKSWNSCNGTGNPMIVLKEKFKKLKFDLKI